MTYPQRENILRTTISLRDCPSDDGALSACHKLEQGAFSPYRLVSLLDLLAQYASIYATLSKEIQGEIAHFRKAKEDNPGKQIIVVNQQDKESGVSVLLRILDEKALANVNLPSVKSQINRMRPKIEKGSIDIDELLHDLKSLAERLDDDLSSQKFLHVRDDLTILFDSEGTPLFGAEVEAKFPQMSEDIVEAGKCVALNRSTASVFHVMRVMEIALQRLGDQLGITLIEEKNWQNILDEVNKAIKGLDHKLLRTKALAQLASHLYNVKVAWRNEVMHPKQTYTPDEALTIFANVRTFVKDLAGII